MASISLSPSSSSSFYTSNVTSKWDLVLAGYSKATQLKYFNAAHRFCKWFANQPVSSSTYVSFPPSPRVMDNFLSDYLYVLYSQGVGKAEATCTLYGICMLYPHLRKSLPLSRAVLHGYTSLLPSNPHPPMPWTVCTALAMWLAFNKKFPLAVAIILSFDCYLRIGEVLKLVKDDIAFSDDPRLGVVTQLDRVHINIRAAKTGVLQGVEVRNPHVKQLIRVWHSSCTGPKLFSFSESTYRKWFSRGCNVLGVTHYTPHSLRHGGATKDYLDKVDIADITVRGRWRNIKTTTHYIQMGPQLMLLHKVPTHVASIGAIVAEFLVPALVVARYAASLQS